MTEDDLRYPGWRVAAAGAFGVFLSFASVLVYTFGVFLKPLTETFHWSRESVSAAFGVAALTAAATSPLLGALLDRVGPRRVILPCLTIFGSAFASLAWLTPNLWHVYAIFFLLGAVANGTAQMAYSRAISTWFDQRRGVALAILMTGGAIGAMTLPSVASWLIRINGWRGAFAAIGVAVLLLGLPVVAKVIREHPDSAARRGHRQPGSTVGQGFRSRAFWLIVATLFLASLGQNSAITHMPAMLSDRGVPSAQAALSLSVLGAASLTGRLGTGWLLDRFNATRVSFWLLALAASGLWLLASADTLLAGCAAALLIGLGLGGEADVVPYLISRYFGLRSFSTIYGFTWTFYAIAGALGPVWIGRIFDTTKSYYHPLLILGALTLAAATLMLLMPKVPHKLMADS